MNCRACEKKLPQYAQGLLAAGDALRVAEHLETCSRCRLEVQQYARVWAGLDSLPAPDAPSVYPQVIARIDALEQQSPSRLRVWLEPFTPSFAGAAAAVMLAGFLIGALFSSVYYADTAPVPSEPANLAYAELLSGAPDESFYDVYMESAGQNGKENTI